MSNDNIEFQHQSVFLTFAIIQKKKLKNIYLLLTIKRE